MKEADIHSLGDEIWAENRARRDEFWSHIAVDVRHKLNKYYHSPSLAHLWSGEAEFISENPNEYVAMSVNLHGPTAHSGGGKLSIGHLKDGRLVGIYRYEKTPTSD